MGIRKYLGITFLAGLFLIGIGAGVTFVEFSSFQLGEEKAVGGESMEMNVMQEKIPQDSGNIYVYLNDVKRKDVEVVTDPSMAADEIEIQTEYNGKALSSYFHTDEEDNEFFVEYYYRDFYGFHYMDDILTSIKNKKIPNYKWEYFGKHVIRIAPENEARLVVYN